MEQNIHYSRFELLILKHAILGDAVHVSFFFSQIDENIATLTPTLPRVITNT
jgi:hypothetical protein